jgi:hypothetical protein
LPCGTHRTMQLLTCLIEPPCKSGLAACSTHSASPQGNALLFLYQNQCLTALVGLSQSNLHVLLLLTQPGTPPTCPGCASPQTHQWSPRHRCQTILLKLVHQLAEPFECCAVVLQLGALLVVKCADTYLHTILRYLPIMQDSWQRLVVRRSYRVGSPTG